GLSTFGLDADRSSSRVGQRPSLRTMRAVQITRFGGPEVMDVVDLPDPVPGDGEQLFDISSSGVNFADTHHRLSTN
ncbi:MAG: putative Zn-dependent oxidoreductase, NADPH:quinone reductase, partial [Modestobacter sp.]|nr:putative Zn-dependent oxidoreductase, NADPH:quinone reductase [Modestobacter sp.]